MHVRFGAGQLVGQAREKRSAVDQKLDLVAAAGLRLAVGPQTAGGVQRTLPPGSREPSPVVGADQRLDPVADGCIEAIERIQSHQGSLPASRRSLIRKLAQEARFAYSQTTMPPAKQTWAWTWRHERGGSVA